MEEVSTERGALACVASELKSTVVQYDLIFMSYLSVVLILTLSYRCDFLFLFFML